jgi:hypothetical protein
VKPKRPHEGGTQATSHGRGESYTELARLASYRGTAQAIRRTEGPLRQRLAKLIDLMQAARSEPDRWTREVAEGIVWAQSEWLLQGDEVLYRHGVRDRVERAARRLRLKGFESCPTCEQRLSDPSDWAFWSAFKRVEVARLEALEREGAA